MEKTNTNERETAVTINVGKEPLCIYAISATGWGYGKTVAEALRQMYSMSRGVVKPEGIVDDLERQRVSLYVSNQTEGMVIANHMPYPMKGKWVLHLGDEFNAIKPYRG